jgi:hypothetical protein
MTSLGRQLGGEGGWRASGSDRIMIEHEQCCFVRHYDEEYWTMSLLAFALGLLWGGEGDRKAVMILFQWNFEIGPLGYDTEIVFILGFRAVLFM